MLEWGHEDLQTWIKTGCNKEIALKVIKLDISKNNIKVLDRKIGFLINLEEFLCFKNNIKKLIPEIGNLIHLELFNF